ncbi:MAG TPA: hypothetical protein GXZ36_08475 [Firmicutes bacterium]|nr:hypothetical protein [Bacillota bacterium]
MKVAAFSTPPSAWRRLVAGFLLGLLLGATGTVLVTGRRLEGLFLDNLQLARELNQERAKAEQLTASLTKRKKRVITSLQIETTRSEGMYKPFFHEYIHDLLGDLVGMEIARVEPKLIWNIINDRRVQMKEEIFLLSAQWVLIDEETRIGVEVQPVGRR